MSSSSPWFSSASCRPAREIPSPNTATRYLHTCPPAPALTPAHTDSMPAHRPAHATQPALLPAAHSPPVAPYRRRVAAYR
eukprot:2008418-Rhodomonas_salina.1